MVVLTVGSAEPKAPSIVESVAAGASDPMLVLGSEARILYANAAAESLFGEPATALAGTPIGTLLRGATEAIVEACSRRFSPVVDTTNPLGGERPMLTLKGAPPRPVDVRISPVGAEGEMFACVSIRAGADDPGLAGRSDLAKALEASGPAGPLAAGLAVFDVDHFELVNESLGRAGGNRLLSELGELIRSLATGDELAARLEADRFALVVGAGTDVGDRAEQILEAIRAQRWQIGDSVFRLTASAGACAVAAGRQSGEQTILNAETALRGAKQAGRDRCQKGHEATRAEALLTIGWTDRIRSAIEDGALIPHFQPILDLHSGRVSHYELLARIREPGGGLIQPDTFIPVAERLGMIGVIDRWAIRTATETLAAWGDRPGAPRIAVNASGRSVGSAQLMSCLQEELWRHGVDAGRLIVEVTETAAIGSIKDAESFGDELRALGVGFALDDFGAGFGTFYYLKHLPLDQVKIDGEFIRGVARSASDQVFVKALVDMAGGLGIRTVAEFVADQATLEVVRDLGIDYAQGFHIGRPTGLAEADASQRAAQLRPRCSTR